LAWRFRQTRLCSLDERTTAPDYLLVQSFKEYILMQINSIPAVAIAFALLLVSVGAIAAEQNNPKSTKADDTFEAKTAGKPEVRSRDVADPAAEAESSTKATKSTRTVKVRNTRPQVDHHKDARECLKAGSSEAIARCSRKYR